MFRGIINTNPMMPRQTDTVHHTTQPPTFLPFWQRVLYWVCSAGLGWFSWQIIRGFSSGFIRLSVVIEMIVLAGLVLLFAALTICLARSLSAKRIPVSWRYRLAFLSSTLWGIVLWMKILPQIHLAPGVAGTIAAMLGAFMGGLAATTLDDCFWENNSPPAPSIEAEVKRLHTDCCTPLARLPACKRVFDFFLAGFGLVLSFPVWLAVTFLIWFEQPGPVLFVKNSVGMGGKNFRQFKFRTMVREAEQETGPVWASEADERVLAVGRLLRKTALDELPQLLNILKGEMSFVGPRPQRTVLVHSYLQQMPEYAERHRIAPGLAGLAQVAGDYYLTPRQKLRFDRLYIQHASLGFDLKLVLLAFLITFWFRWQRNWNGRLPHRLLHKSNNR